MNPLQAIQVRQAQAVLAQHGLLPKDTGDNTTPKDEPEPEAKPAKKKTKKKEQAVMMSHAEKMKKWGAYRSAYNQTRAMVEPGAPMSAATRQALAKRGAQAPFAKGGIADMVSGKPKVSQVKYMPEGDKCAVLGGFDGEEGMLAQHAALGLAPRDPTAKDPLMFVSTGPVVQTAAPTPAQAHNELARAKRAAGVK
jgi:hypothetical protein